MELKCVSCITREDKDGTYYIVEFEGEAGSLLMRRSTKEYKVDVVYKVSVE